MKAGDVITKARYSLSDTDSDNYRWSDDRLLSLLNDVQLDLASTTRLFNSVLYLALDNYFRFYDLSKVAICLERIEHNGIPVEFYSYVEMDNEFGRDWKDKTTDDRITHIVYDLERPCSFITYPYFTAGKDTAPTTSFENSNFDGVTGYYDRSYGLLRDRKGKDVRADAKPDTYVNIFYDIKDSTKSGSYLVVYHTKLPKLVSSIDDVLDIVITPSMITGLVHYIVGKALRDNMDTVSRSVGNEELQIYAIEKQSITSKRMVNNIKRPRQFNFRPLG